MKAKVIFYSQKKIMPKQRTKFKKELAGHNDTSHGGKYTYKIKGLLDTIQHIKPSYAALIVKGKDYKTVVSLMKKYSIDYTIYNIEVPATQFMK